MQSTTTMIASKTLVDFYERDVLPVLFERLDRAFPELQWSPAGSGWVGARHDAQTRSSTSTDRIFNLVCHQPWGFVSRDGTVTSWLAYVNNGTEPTGAEFADAVLRLAHLAGVDATPVNQRVSREEQHAACRRHRRHQLLEAFVAYCHVNMNGPSGAAAGDYLQRRYGIDVRYIEKLPLGVYTNPHDMMDYLVGVGFSGEEVVASGVRNDSRLEGRLMIPWRDRWGTIQTVIAEDPAGSTSSGIRRLHLQRDVRPDGFGLDVAMRPAAGGRQQLILVEDILDVVYLHSQGQLNVAMVGNGQRLPQTHHWEQLASEGVESVVLAFADDTTGRARTCAAVRTSAQTTHCPRIESLPPQGLGEFVSTASCVRHRHVGGFRELLGRRVHGYRYYALSLLDGKRGTDRWDASADHDLMASAAEFDQTMYTTERAAVLDQHFWPPILSATGAEWTAVRPQLTHRPPVVEQRSERPANLQEYYELVGALNDCLQAGRIDRFKELVLSAARRWGYQPVDQAHTAQPLLDEWIAEYLPFELPVNAEDLPSTPLRVHDPASADVRPLTGNPLPTPDAIQQLAYHLWEQHGRPAGLDQHFWHQARAELCLNGYLRKAE